MAELWDLYTKHREKTGKEHIRGEKIPPGYYHLVVHIWIRNSQGKYLISQRSADRPTFPLMWECVGGSVLKGENSIDGAVREVKEEVGITLDPQSGQKLFSKVREAVNGKPFQDILDVWLFEYDGELQLENATEHEVEQCMFMSVDEIRKLYDDGKMVKTLGYFFGDVETDIPDYDSFSEKSYKTGE